MINPEALELNIRHELAASRERGENCFCCTYGLAEIMLEYIEQTKENKTMKYFNIGCHSLSGNYEASIQAQNLEEALKEARDIALETDEALEYLNKVRTIQEVAQKDFGISFEEADAVTRYIIRNAYLKERESRLNYWAQEITKEEYCVEFDIYYKEEEL